ncbi:MAG TPA: bifunctional riboflavin kinase/FAD synthetase [Frankiaceae bacterium]|nr:bifunctional riboflavin kinase/FAD synthetase [Frankiaceae bacterium]
MQRWRGLSATPTGWGRCVVTIGVYDGVHLGHRKIIGRAVERAREVGQPSVVVTFDPHPSEVLRPGSHPAVLSPPGFKADLLEGLGVDVLCVLPFTLDFSRLGPDEFVHEVLVDALHASAVVVGENFTYGRKAAGNVESLARSGRTFGFSVEGVPLLGDHDGAESAISSTYIRSCVAGGDVVAAARALGRPHRVEGIVVRGDRRGRELGFPTANLATTPYAAVPADGIYAGHFREEPGGPPMPAAISIGTNPTFSGRERRVEAFVLDFDGDLYGEHVSLDFVERLRATERYTTSEALVEQIARDVERTRELLASPQDPSGPGPVVPAGN